MLCDEHGMIAPRCLFPIVRGESGRQSLGNEFLRVLEDFPHPFASQVLELFLVEMHPAAKR